MIRILVAALLVGHGLVHGIMFGLPFSEQTRADLPFDPGHSWLLGSNRTLAFAVATMVTIAYASGGAGYLERAEWWPDLTLAASVASIALLLLYLSRYWVIGIGISIVWPSSHGGPWRQRTAHWDRRSNARQPGPSALGR